LLVVEVVEVVGFQHLLVDPLGQSLQEQKLEQHLKEEKLQKREHLQVVKRHLLLQHNKMTK
jgi:hypothetical protein